MRKTIAISLLAMFLVSCVRTKDETVEQYPNGNPYLIQTVKYKKNNRMVVYETYFYETGSVYMKGGMVAGQRDGEWVSYHPNGKLQSTGTYVNGLREGYGPAYYENGNLLMEGNYKEGVKTGVWKYYDVTGELIETNEYK